MDRIVNPEAIDFSQAIPVAVVGLVVNLVSAALLHGDHDHGHGHDHRHHDHHDDHGHGDDHGHDHGHGHAHHEHGHGHPHAAAERAHAKAKGSPLTHDHNLQAAYLHVVADALTSLLAIVALVVGRRTGFTLLDPLMGVVGAIVIARWAWQLLARAARPLLDMVPASVDMVHLREVLEEASAGEVVDMHVWEMGPNEVCCVVALAAHKAVDIETCRRIVVKETAVDHLTIELRPCSGEHPRHEAPARVTHDRRGHEHGHAHGHAHTHAHD